MIITQKELRKMFKETTSLYCSGVEKIQQMMDKANKDFYLNPSGITIPTRKPLIALAFRGFSIL